MNEPNRTQWQIRSEIDQIRIRKFYAGLVKQGLAASTIKFYHSLICPALELAVDSNMIRKNPAKDARKGIGGTKREKTYYHIAAGKAAGFSEKQQPVLYLPSFDGVRPVYCPPSRRINRPAVV